MICLNTENISSLDIFFCLFVYCLFIVWFVIWMCRKLFREDKATALWPTVLFSYNNIRIFYPYRGGITYFKCIEINKVSLSKHRVSFELGHVFAGPSVPVFGNQNMVTLGNGILAQFTTSASSEKNPTCFTIVYSQRYSLNSIH